MVVRFLVEVVIDEGRNRHVRKLMQGPGSESIYLTEMWSSSEEGSYLRLIDFHITQL